MDIFTESPHLKLAKAQFYKYPYGKVYPSRDEEVWRPYIECIDAKYANKKSLPKGTVFYHGSLSNKFYFHPNSVRYFGLDFAISAWKTPEKWRKKYKDLTMPPYSKWIGYVHVFKLKKALPYHYIAETDCVAMDHPNTEICSNKPCVHPQVVFHEGPMRDNDLIDIGTELTIPKNFESDYIQYIGYHKIDIVKMVMYRVESPQDWNCQTAVLSSENANKET